MKDCFDDSEPKPKLKLKLSAPEVKHTRQYANPKLLSLALPPCLSLIDLMSPSEGVPFVKRRTLIMRGW
ncbi:hypothetical protein Ancab_001272 [Ancistrocladus abbreviatus]